MDLWLPQGRAFSGATLRGQIVPEYSSTVLIVVAVDAQVFPIRAIGGIVVVIPIFMMDGEQTFIGLVELSATLRANQPVNLQGLFPVGVRR